MDVEKEVSEILQSRSEEGGFRKIQDILNPHRHKPYPMNKIDDFSRFPLEYRWMDKERRVGWISAAVLQAAVGKIVPEVMNYSVEDFIAMANWPLNLRADDSFIREWREEESIKQIGKIEEESPGARWANEILADRVLQEGIKNRLQDGRDVYLLDAGIGELGTTGKIIRDIDYGLRKKLHVIGLDAKKSALNKSREMLTSSNPEYGGLKKRNVKMIQTIFGQLHENRKIRKYRGKIHYAVSGASTHHQADVEPFFRTVNELLADGGIMEVWDWLHWLWVGQVVRVGDRGNVPELYKEGLKQMVKVWVGLHGYGDYYKDKVVKDLESSIYTDGFSFHYWMGQNLVGVYPDPENKTIYRSAEGHRAPEIYTDIIDHHFSNVVHYPVKELITDEEIPTAALLHGFSARKLSL